MGLFDGFKKMLGSPKEPEPVAISFEKTEDWLKKTVQPQLETLKKDALNRFSEIRFLLKDIIAQLNVLEEKSINPEEANERVRKVVSSSQQSLVMRMKNLLQRIEPPQAANWDGIQSYGSTAFLLLQKETSSFGKNIAYTSILLKEEIKGIGERLKELEKILKSLSSSFSKDSLFEHAKTARTLKKELTELQQENKALETKSEQLEKELKQAEKNAAEQKSILTSLQDSSEAKEIESLFTQNSENERKKQELHSELLDLIGGIDKPLKRFSKLVSSKHWTLEKSLAEFLEQLVKNPVSAFESDPKAQSFKAILKELQSAIADQKISFKDEKEKAKRINSLNQLLEFDFFSGFFWKQNELEKEKQKTEKQIKSNSFSKKLQEKTLGLRQKSTAISQLQTAVIQNNSLIEKNSHTIKEKRILLEKKLSMIANTKVTVSF